MTKLGRIEARQREVAGEIVERRRIERVTVRVAGRLRLPGVDVAYPCTVVNLSHTGVYVHTDSLLPQGAMVELELSPTGCLLPLQARGRIVRQGADDQSPGMGIALEWVSVEATAFIERVLARANP